MQRGTANNGTVSELTVNDHGMDIAPEAKPARRPRRVTTLKLQWVAEQVRKANRIKEEVANGTYKVNSLAVARAILNRIED